jgi:hypothetical protein
MSVPRRSRLRGRRADRGNSGMAFGIGVSWLLTAWTVSETIVHVA